jgi:hypothetical protein
MEKKKMNMKGNNHNTTTDDYKYYNYESSLHSRCVKSHMLSWLGEGAKQRGDSMRKKKPP